MHYIMTLLTQWFSIIGLFLDIIGAIFLAFGLFISRKEAIELGIPVMGGDDEKENLTLPAVKDRLKQRRNAIGGFIFLILGFAFQILGNWPK